MTDYLQRALGAGIDARDKARRAEADDLNLALRYYQEAIKQFELAKGLNVGVPEAQPKRDAAAKQLAWCQGRAQMVQQQLRTSGGGGGGLEGSTKGGATVREPPPKGAKPKSKDDDDSAARDRMHGAILVERPDIGFADVAGLNEAKQNLIEAVILPTKLPHFFGEGGVTPWRGILLYGPPGTGKGVLAKATAKEAAGSTFLTVTTADLVSKWLGESEKLIRALFDTAREMKPAVVFIDEIDSLLGERTGDENQATLRIKTEFLIQIDGVGKSFEGILLLAATNCPWNLDPAVIRRFERRVYIPLPDEDARRALFKLRLDKMRHAVQPHEIEELVRSTEGYSGADLSIVCRAASMAPVTEVQRARYFVKRPDGWIDVATEAEIRSGASYVRQTSIMEMSAEQAQHIRAREITMADFREALRKTRPSVAPDHLKKYEAWTAKYGQDGA